MQLVMRQCHVMPVGPFTVALAVSSLLWLAGCQGTGLGQQGRWTAEEVVVGLWTPDTEIQNEAIAWATRVRDPRVLEALVGKLKAECTDLDPGYYYPMSVVTALEYQGAEVEVTTNGYRVRYPGCGYWLSVPLKRTATEVPE
jgi:hypothetical protein